jgi:competence protein ComEC
MGIDKVDAVILSHPDIDHYGGLSAVLEEFEIKEFYRTGLCSWTPPFRAFMRRLIREQCVVRWVRQGGTIDLDPKVTCDVLWPPVNADIRNDYSSHYANTMSMVLSITYGKVTVLMTGDIKRDSEMKLVKKYGSRLGAQVLKVAHHGSGSSSRRTFVRTVSPRIAVIMGERFNLESEAWRRASSDTLERLKYKGCRVLRTQRKGSVLIETDGESLVRVLTARGVNRQRGDR